MEPQIRYARTSDGVNIAYCVMGTGTPLVYPSNAWGDVQWYIHNEPTRREVDRLIAAGWQVVRYDMRGFGSSDRDVVDYSLAGRVKDLEAVVNHAGIDRFALFGFGHAGPVAITYAVQCPERVSHLVLVNSFAVGAEYYRLVPLIQSVVALRPMAEGNWEFFTMSIATASLGFKDPELAKKTAEMLRTSASAKTYFGFSDEAEKIDVTEVLSQVKTPTLVVLDRSGYAAESLSRGLASGIPGARFVGTDDVSNELHAFVRGESLAPARHDTADRSGTAIILFADIVDSTALTERIGDAAFRKKARGLDEEMRRCIRESNGNAVEGKTLGDGVLAVFTSAKLAIACARAFNEKAGAAGLALHVGIHAGDVIREADNVYGGAVNIAARISGLSAPGEVLVSDTVRSLARTSAGVAFVDRGEQELKGVGEAVRVWAVESAG